MRFSENIVLKSLKTREYVLIALAVLSLLALYIPQNWFLRSLELDLSAFPARLVADERGATEVSWVDKDQGSWRCLTDAQIKHAFCSLILMVNDGSRNGVDLSRFSTVSVQGDYQGNGETVRLYLRNRHPAYFVEGDELSTKYNLIELPVDWLKTGKSFGMNKFVVAEWWRDARKIRTEKSAPEFNDVIYIELQTGSYRAGEDVFALNKIYFEGSYFSKEQVYRTISILWVVVIVALLLLRAYQLHKEIKLHSRDKAELYSLNALLKLKNQEVEEIAKTDLLTGAYNRLGVREFFQKGLYQWMENKQAFCLIFIDLDHFKKVNDTRGHDIGDETLVALVELIKKNVSDNCILARWGGEEFILACLNTNLTEANEIAEGLRSKIEATTLYSGVKLTASFGVASLNDKGASDLIARADEAVYLAKSLGRNRVVCETEIAQGKVKQGALN